MVPEGHLHNYLVTDAQISVHLSKGMSKGKKGGSQGKS
jgi:hypothetical protein